MSHSINLGMKNIVQIPTESTLVYETRGQAEEDAEFIATTQQPCVMFIFDRQSNNSFACT